MSLGVAVARVALGLVLLVAGAAKLARLEATRASLAQFGVPQKLLLPGSFALPAAEIMVAGLLVPATTARVAAFAAVALLTLFTLVVIRALALGQQLECNCFGALRSKPVSRLTVLRNLVLIGVATAVGVAGPGTLSASLSTRETVAFIGAGVILAVTAGNVFFSMQLFRQNGRLLDRVAALEANAPGGGVVEGLSTGTAAPDFVLSDLDGQPRSLRGLLERGRPLALAFVDPDCGACGAALTQLATARERRAGDLAVAVVTRGEPNAARQKVNGYELDAVLIQEAREVADAFAVYRVPSVQIVGTDGFVKSPLAIGDEAIRRLLDSPSSYGLHPNGAPA